MARLTASASGLLILLQVPSALANAPTRAEATQRNDTVTPAAKARTSPVFLLTPTADAAFGHHAFFSTQLGAAMFVSVILRLRLGVSAALSENVTNGLEGCSTTETCVRSWTRLAGNLEYHHFPGSRLDFWWGLQAGAEWRDADVHSTGSGWDNEKRTYALVQPSAGIDIVAATGRTAYGVGIYAGIPLSFGSSDSSFGGLLGIRGLLGIN
jgi:hypothetical protein